MTAAAPWSFSTNVAAGGAARQGLDAAGAAAGEQVEDAGAGQLRLEDREERLLHPVGERPRAGAGRGSRMPFAEPAITRPASATVRPPLAGLAGPDAREPARLELAARAARLRAEAARASSRSASACVARRASPARRARGSGATRPAAAAGRTGPGRGRRPRDGARSPSRRARTRRGSRRPPSGGPGRSRRSMSETRTQNDLAVPRPTRPRSWWSWASPNRSAPSMTIIVASGTSTPTSTTVVPTSTSSSPSRNRAISASRSAAFIRPWTMPDPERREQLAQADRLGLGGRRRRIEDRRRPPSSSARLGLVDQRARRRTSDGRPPPPSRTRVPDRRRAASGCRIPVRIGMRPSGGVRRSETSRSA